MQAKKSKTRYETNLQRSAQAAAERQRDEWREREGDGEANEKVNIWTWLGFGLGRNSLAMALPFLCSIRFRLLLFSYAFDAFHAVNGLLLWSSVWRALLCSWNFCFFFCADDRWRRRNQSALHRFLSIHFASRNLLVLNLTIEKHKTIFHSHFPAECGFSRSAVTFNYDIAFLIIFIGIVA